MSISIIGILTCLGRAVHLCYGCIPMRTCSSSTEITATVTALTSLIYNIVIIVACTTHRTSATCFWKEQSRLKVCLTELLFNKAGDSVTKRSSEQDTIHLYITDSDVTELIGRKAHRMDKILQFARFRHTVFSFGCPEGDIATESLSIQSHIRSCVCRCRSESVISRELCISTCIKILRKRVVPRERIYFTGDRRTCRNQHSSGAELGQTSYSTKIEMIEEGIRCV